MNNRTGVVMQVKGSTAMLMTPSGEFINVKIKKRHPKIGEEFVGEVAKPFPLHRYLTVAASLFFILFIGSGITAYCTPAATIRVDINPSLELKLNRWHRVLSVDALNEDGSKLLSSLHLRNNSLDESLNKIIDEAKRENYINNQYIASGKDITITVEQNKKDIDFDFSAFEQHLKDNHLELQIQNNTENQIIKKGAEAQNNKSSVLSNKSKKDIESASDSSGSLKKDAENPSVDSSVDNNDVLFTPPGQEKKETNNAQKNIKTTPPGSSQKKNTQDESFPSKAGSLHQDDSAKQYNNNKGITSKEEKNNHKDQEEKDDKKSNSENGNHGKKDE